MWRTGALQVPWTVDRGVSLIIFRNGQRSRLRNGPIEPGADARILDR